MHGLFKLWHREQIGMAASHRRCWPRHVVQAIATRALILFPLGFRVGVLDSILAAMRETVCAVRRHLKFRDSATVRAAASSTYSRR